MIDPTPRLSLSYDEDLDALHVGRRVIQEAKRLATGSNIHTFKIATSDVAFRVQIIEARQTG